MANLPLLTGFGNRQWEVSLGFLMTRVLSTATAELLELKTFRGGLLILCSDVVATFAIRALQYDIVTRHKLKSPGSGSQV
jgi:hypothetical protein